MSTTKKSLKSLAEAVSTIAKTPAEETPAIIEVDYDEAVVQYGKDCQCFTSARAALKESFDIIADYHCPAGAKSSIKSRKELRNVLVESAVAAGVSESTAKNVTSGLMHDAGLEIRKAHKNKKADKKAAGDSAKDKSTMVEEMLPKHGPCGWGAIAIDNARAAIAAAKEAK